jgi:hypothetical protein
MLRRIGGQKGRDEKQLVEVTLFEKGDRVFTPDGPAIVEEDEKFVDENWRTIKVRWLETSHRI